MYKYVYMFRVYDERSALAREQLPRLSGFSRRDATGPWLSAHLLQSGRDPRDWKVLKSLGKGISGVYEIRTSTNSDIYRVAYVTKIADSIVILHSWQKKTEATAKSDINLIVDRYRSAMKELT